MITLEFTLPWPPSTNRYWMTPRRGPLAGRKVLTKEARHYKRDVAAVVAELGIACENLAGRLQLAIVACEPNLRARDLSNLLKIVEDALVTAEVIEDDSLIDDLHIVRGPLCRPFGKLDLVIRQIALPVTVAEQEALL